MHLLWQMYALFFLNLSLITFGIWVNLICSFIGAQIFPSCLLLNPGCMYVELNLVNTRTELWSCGHVAQIDSKNSRCLRLIRYDSLETRHRSQKNGWMYSNGFKSYIEWWYNEIYEKSNGSSLLVMDNCGVHESEITLPGLWIEFLPPRSTAKYHPLDLGLIAHRKICYRSNLLRPKIDLMLERQSGAREFPSRLQLRIHGARHGFLTTIGDAMETLDESCHDTSRAAFMKCLMKNGLST